MKKYITLLLPLLVACGSNSCKPDPITFPDAGVSVEPTSIPSISPSSSTSVEVPMPTIKWYPYSEDTYKLLQTKSVCAMIYFGGTIITLSSETNENILIEEDTCSRCKIMEEIFKLPQIVKVINDKFIPFRYPVNSTTYDHMVRVIGVHTLPTIMLIPNKQDLPVLSASGIADVDILMKGFNDPIFDSCGEGKKDL